MRICAANTIVGFLTQFAPQAIYAVSVKMGQRCDPLLHVQPGYGPVLTDAKGALVPNTDSRVIGLTSLGGGKQSGGVDVPARRAPKVLVK